MDIEQKSHLVKAAKKAAWAARLKYLPTATINLGWQAYDNNYAESAALLIPEKQVFSESALTKLSTHQHW